MPILVATHSIESRYGSRTLFSDVSISVSDGDRVGMIGPNGTGKSTLLRILAAIEQPDAGTRSQRALTRLAYVAQVPDYPPAATVESVLAAALAPDGVDPLTATTRIAATLGRVGFDDLTAKVSTLSGGWRKRLAIAAALVREPEVVLLDEPTNHLDLEGVLWLEKLLRNAPFAFLVVTHDRWFLENVATRVIELNKVYPGSCFSVDGPYSEFLLRRNDFLAAQAQYADSLANKVRREVEWLRRGAKARATKAKGRIDEAGRMIAELADLDKRQARGSAGIDFDGSGRRTKKLLDARAITKSLGGRTLFRDLDLVLGPKERLGVLGGNGSGKTTLLRTLTREIAPDSGTVVHADALQVVYFDQGREQLDLSLTLRQALTPSGGDSVIYRGTVQHVAGWARRFLFRTEQLETQLSRLSGGEQARVLIAQLMLRPADLLVLDEPTNDLDIETLELLEESLTDFPGCLILVTHDRYMLDRVSTQLLALDGEGGAQAYADYYQWETAQRARPARSDAPSPTAPVRKPAAKSLSYKDKQELDRMEESILAAESRVESLQAKLNDPALSADASALAACWKDIESAKAAVESLYARWTELEAKKS